MKSQLDSSQLKRLHYEPNKIYGYEPMLNKFVQVAYWHSTRLMWYWCHGYYPPHPYAERIKRFAKRNHQKTLL